MRDGEEGHPTEIETNQINASDSQSPNRVSIDSCKPQLARRTCLPPASQTELLRQSIATYTSSSCLEQSQTSYPLKSIRPYFRSLLDPPRPHLHLATCLTCLTCDLTILFYPSQGNDDFQIGLEIPVMASQATTQKPQIQPCRYKTGEPRKSGETNPLADLWQEKHLELGLIQW